MTIGTHAITGAFTADTVHSTFQFTVKHMKVASFTATFDDVRCRATVGDDGITLDGAVNVESISIRTPQEFRDHVVYSDDFLDAKRFPEILFRSSDVELAEDGSATIRGELTIKGVTKPFLATGTYQLPVEDPYGDTRAAVDFSATIDRREWGLDWQAPMPNGGNVLGWAVTINANVELVKEG